MEKIKKVVISLVCIIILGYVFYFTAPPTSWEQASTTQILAIFLPVLVLGTLLADIFFKYLPKSFLVGLGIMATAVLQALHQLTPLIALGLILAAILSARLFPKIKIKEIKEIRKLGLSNNPKKSTLPRFPRRHKP